MTAGPFGASGIVALALGLGSTGLAASVEPAPEDVSPGVLGFLVTLAVVLACIPLFRSMTGKIRGVEFRDAQRGAGPDAADAITDAPPDDPPPDDPPHGDVPQDRPPARP